MIPALAAGAVVAVVAAVAASGLGSGAGGLRPLALGGAAADDSALSASAELRAAASYELDAALPEGPSEEAVRRFAQAAAEPAAVARLAAALGIGSAPTRGSGQWEATGPGGALVVLDEPGQPWSYQRDGLLDRPGGCPDTPVTSDPTVGPDASSALCIGPPVSAPPGSGSGSDRLWVGQRGLRGRRRDGHAGSGPGAGPRDGSGLAAVPRTRPRARALARAVRRQRARHGGARSSRPSASTPRPPASSRALRRRGSASTRWSTACPRPGGRPR